MYILTNKKSFPSARILRDSMRELLNRRILVSSKLKDFAPIVRYGNSNGKFRQDTFLNSPEFIRLISNKKAFSDLLLANGLNSPNFSRKIPEDSDFPIVVRKKLQGCKGDGIVICKNRKEYQGLERYFWTKWIEIKFELRLHIIGGKLEKIFKKIPLGDEGEFPIRISDNCHYSLVNGNNYPKLIPVIDILNKVIGTENFYALDIGWDLKNRNYFIFEGNSAPGINESTSGLYAKFIIDSLEANNCL